jgi:hypothetical protein
MKRLLKLFTVPLQMIYAKLYPEKYAKKIGVNAAGEFRIYGSSYAMFGTEPWLVNLGENVHITLEVKFICHDGGTLILRRFVPDLEITKPITVGNNVYIGVRTIILPGVNIGDNSIIGAGSIVTKDIPPNSVAAGIPARVIKTTDEYFGKIKNESLHLGHLDGKTKAKELKKLYNIT